MYFIKSCPQCGKKLRFPIDKGKIKISCRCGFSFIADPDDPALYKNGSFDLKYNDSKKEQNIVGRVIDVLSNLRFHHFRHSAINNFLKFNYRIQNFRILGKEERKKLIIIAVAILLVIAIFVMLILHAFNLAEKGILVKTGSNIQQYNLILISVQ